MPISFTAAERLAITRRQVRIDLENAGFTTSLNSFNDQQAALLQVDVSNTKFYDYYNLICQAYEAEARYMNGGIPDVYSPSDIVSAAQTPSVDPFFPITPAPAYTRNIPLIQDGSHTNNKVKGFFHPTGTDARYEQNILTNTASPTQGLTQLINWLLNGISYGSGNTTTQNPLHTIPGGTVTGVQVDVVSTTGFNVNDLVYINSGSQSGIYKITAKDAAHLTLDSVLPSTTGFTLIGTTIKNTVAGFTNTERQNLTSATYQELLTNLTNTINSVVTEWEGKIDLILAVVNGDERSPQASQFTAAIADATNTKSIIDTWQARTNTGVNGKYADNGINPLSAEVTARITFVSGRLTEIATALGSTSLDSLSQSGNDYASNYPTNPYHNRYKWLNFRINRSSGSLRRYYAANQAKDAVQSLLNDNNAIKAEYDSYFLTKSVIFNDGSDILHLKNLTGLSNGNILTIVSETQPEITRTIVQTMGTTQVKLDSPVPTTYKLEDTARAFKTL